jgi:Cellulose binding domain/Glycosyl hydrolase family 26
MRHWMGFGRPRTAALIAATGLLLGAAVAVPAMRSAWAADASTKYLGIFREASPTAIASGTISRYGVKPASVLWFDSWATGNAFNVSEARALASQGIMPHFTWEPWNTALGVSDPNQIHLQDIINGTWDNYIRARGAEFASVGSPIMVRWGHEFNGNWYPWGIVNNNSNPALYVAAYKRVHDLVVAAGATNVQWVWCFGNGSVPDSPFNDPAQSYPGDAYVDWVAIDGYNWGFGPSWDPTGNHWTSFNTMFASAYAKARAIAPRRPVMVAETASSEDGGSKAQWINDMSSVLTSGGYPDLKLITYFDQDKEELWSAGSSSASLAAFTSWVRQPYMNGTGPELAQVAAQYKGTPSPSPSIASPSPSPSSRPSSPPSSPPPSSPGTGGRTCSAAFSVTSSWPGGFVAGVTVTAGASAITGWTVSLTLPSGATVTNSWNATATGTSGTVSFASVSYNGSLAARQSTSLGFQGTGSAAGTAVASCTAS